MTRFVKLIQRLRLSRTAIRPQFQTTECGIGVLRAILAYYGADLTAYEVRKISAVSRDCLNAGDLRRAAHALGLLCSVRSVEVEELRTMKLPLVVHLRFIHFVVLELIDHRTVTINCPAVGRLKMPFEEFSEAFTGIALSLTPGPSFRRSAGAAPKESTWWRWLFTQVWPELGGITLLAAVRAAALLALAFGIDRSGFRYDRLAFVCAAMLLASLGTAILLRRASRRMYRIVRDRLAQKLDRVANDFYVYRLPDVLATTLGDVRPLCESITSSLFPAAVALVEAASLLAGCTLVHSGFALRLTLLFVAWAAAVLWLTHWRRHEDQTRESGRTESSHAAARAFKTPEDVRLGDGPTRFAQVRAGIRAATFRVRLRVDLIHATLARTHLGLLLLALLCLLPPSTGPGSHKIPGLLLAGALCFIAAPFSRLRGLVDRTRRLAFGIRDVLDEPAPVPSWQDAVPSGTELRLEGVTFRFNATKPPILRDAWLTVAAGEQLGITGASGGGKSTATEMMLGIHDPETGRALLGGVPVSHIPMAQRSRLIARIDRRPVLFEATVRENLTLGDPSISEAELERALRDAALTEVIEQLPKGLDTQVEFEGRNFSGGQLQRIEIARALARNPSIVILDDAVDSLDFEVEMQIRRALRRRACTVICVGHRASSLKACDRLMVFRDGQFHEDSSLPEQPSSPVPQAVRQGIFHNEIGDLIEPAPTPGDGYLLGKCWEHLLGRPLPGNIVPPGESPEAAVRRLASSTETAFRAVRFTVPSWWRTDAGRVLVFREDGSPLALVGGRFRTSIFDPRTGTVSLLSRHEASTLRPDGYALLPGSDRAQRTLRARTVCGLRDASKDAGLTVLLTVCAAFCTVLPFAHRGPNPLLSVMSLIGAAVLFGIQAHAASERTQHTLKEREDAETEYLTLHSDADGARKLDIAFLFQALQGLSGLVATTSELLSGGTFAMGLVLFSAACLVLRAGGQIAAWSVLATLMCGLLQLLGPLLGLPLQQRAIDTELFARRRLFATLRGTLRLRSLHRFTESLADWKHADDESSLRTQSLHRMGQLIAPSLVAARATTVACVLLLVVPAAWRSSCIACIWLMAFGFAELGQSFSGLVAQRPSRQAARDLLKLPSECGRHRVETASAMLRLRDVAVFYGGHRGPVLVGHSLSVDPQKMTVLAGASGSGKSTILRLLLGLQHPSKGEVSLNGIPLRDINLAHWRRGIAAVFQGDFLEEAVTIRSQLNPNQDAALADIWDALRVVEMADEVQGMPMGVQTIVESGRISTGQQQRLLIARALLARPSLLVLDEATNAIPDAIQARIFARIRERRIGCLIVSHRESVWQAADVVYVLRDGAVHCGPARQLIGQHHDLLRSAQEVESL